MDNRKQYLFLSIIFLFSLSSSNLKAQESKQHNISVYYPFHLFFDNSYGNTFVRNGFSLGIEYSYTFKKYDIGIFGAAQTALYGKPFLQIKYNENIRNKVFLNRREVYLFSLGVQKRILKAKGFNIIPKAFLNYRTGLRLSALNEEVTFFESSRFTYFRDFGFGLGSLLNYGFTDTFSLGLEANYIYYVHRYRNESGNKGINSSPHLFFMSLKLGFSF